MKVVKLNTNKNHRFPIFLATPRLRRRWRHERASLAGLKFSLPRRSSRARRACTVETPASGSSPAGVDANRPASFAGQTRARRSHFGSLRHRRRRRRRRRVRRCLLPGNASPPALYAIIPLPPLPRPSLTPLPCFVDTSPPLPPPSATQQYRRPRRYTFPAIFRYHFQRRCAPPSPAPRPHDQRPSFNSAIPRTESMDAFGDRSFSPHRGGL